MIQIKSVLIADDIEKECVEILNAAGVAVTVKTKQTKEELMNELPKHDAVVVRSATKITKELITAAAAGRLKLIGRAGTGVDNIDVTAATECGVIVMNTPAGNSRSAAELTCTAILSLARHVPQAAASMKEGKWARKDFMGEEVFGKTLAIIGLGRIGREVATRMQAFGMRTIGFDPIVGAEDAAKSGIEWMSLENLWPLADYITVHVPLIKATENLINGRVLGLCKSNVKIINVARGGIVNEKELVEALNQGKAGGAAFDVFDEEPPKFRELIEHPRVISTPHLGASTNEAQLRVASEIAENIVALNNGVGLFGALNANAMEAVLSEDRARWVRAVQSLTQILAALNKDAKHIKVAYPKGDKQVERILGLDFTALERAFRAGASIGMLNSMSSNASNLINAELNAKNIGISVVTEAITGCELIVSSGTFCVSGYPSPAGTFITAINGCRVPVAVLAIGTLAFTATSNGNSIRVPDRFKDSLLVEYGLLGGGRLTLLSKQDNSSIAELAKTHVVVQFS